MVYVKQLLQPAATGEVMSVHQQEHKTADTETVYVKPLLLPGMRCPSIIRSSKLRIQQRYMSNKQLLLPAAITAGSSSCLTYTVAVYTVLSS
jgi:hypothetical protein